MRCAACRGAAVTVEGLPLCAVDCGIQDYAKAVDAGRVKPSKAHGKNYWWYATRRKA